MIKYLKYDVLISEIPDELSLGFYITGCPVHCPDCHSKELWKDIGNELKFKRYDAIIQSQLNCCTCILFFGGEWEENSLLNLLLFSKNRYPAIKLGLYSGQELSYFNNSLLLKYLSYLKVGPFKKEYGPLNKKTTNQRFYSLSHGKIKEDLTYTFWR